MVVKIFLHSKTFKNFSADTTLKIIFQHLQLLVSKAQKYILPEVRYGTEITCCDNKDCHY